MIGPCIWPPAPDTDQETGDRCEVSVRPVGVLSLAGDDESRDGGVEWEGLSEDSHCHRPVHPHPSSQIIEALRFLKKYFVIWVHLLNDF